MDTKLTETCRRIAALSTPGLLAGVGAAARDLAAVLLRVAARQVRR